MLAKNARMPGLIAQCTNAMRFPYHLALLICLAAIRSAIAQSPETAYESSGPVEAAMLVPAPWMTGAHHRVLPEAWHDGLQVTYGLMTETGEQPVLGTQALMIRIREIEAISELREMSKTKEFTKALAKAGRDKVGSAVDLVSDPLGTVKKLPQGASRFFGRIGESLKGGASKGETGTVASMLGMRTKKAELALKLGVSAYSSNQELQGELNKAARAMAAGAMMVEVAGLAVDGGASAALSVIGVNQTLHDTLVNSTPEDLQAADRKILLGLGVPVALAEEFVLNPWFSPWQEALIVEALNRIGVDPSVFLAVAKTVQTEEDARYFVQLARLYLKQHQDIAPLKSFQIERRILCALDAKDALVVAVSLDYGIWSARMAQRAEEFASLVTPNGPVKSVRLAVDGLLSERVSHELMQRGIVSSAFTLGTWH